ncbi:putative allantoate permease [Colletotrichum lupini]|nr:putative allantoate permease [Colletotrichum lupini]
MSDNIEASPAAADTASGHEVALKGQVADEGYDIFEEGIAHSVPQDIANAVRRKIDRHLLALMCLLYGLNYVDKVAMGWAVLFDFRKDLGLVGDEYSWASSMFYFGYLAAQYPANYMLQRYKTVRILSSAVIIWGVLMLA